MKSLKMFAIALPLFLIAVITISSTKTEALTRPSGMFVKDPSGAYFYVYYTAGTNYSDPRLKYIGRAEVLDYYLKRGRDVYNISNTEKSAYTIHNHNLTFPCGETARDLSGKIAFFEPLGWPPGAQDQGDPVFSYAENFPQYVASVDWGTPGKTGYHYQDILKESGYTQTSVIDGLPEGTLGGINPVGIPNCTIVKQTNSPNYYRVFRHNTPGGVSIQRKAQIGTSEVLNLWLNYSSHTYEADITSLPDVGSAKLPPGLLVRTVTNPNVYFTDDEGNKVLIPTNAKFNELGFKSADVIFVDQSSLNTAPTKNLY